MLWLRRLVFLKLRGHYEQRRKNHFAGSSFPAEVALDGGKGPVASWIVSLMPEYLHYVEPFFGGGSVLFAKEQQGSEVVNDLDGDLMNFWMVLADPVSFKDFGRRVEACPVSEALWRQATEEIQHSINLSPVERALAFFVHVRQSLAGRRQMFTALSKTRLRRGMNEQASAWLSAVDGLRAAHLRLRSVVIRCNDALEVIRQEDDPKTLFYLDPPYLAETRASPGVYGDYELGRQQHIELLQLVIALQGKVMLSAYPSSLYNEYLGGWRSHIKDVPNHASHAKYKAREQEVLWCNF